MNELRSREIFRSKTLSVTAVERVGTRHRRSAAGCHFVGIIDPIAIIVSAGDDEYALDTTGHPTDLDKLKRELRGVAGDGA